MTKKKSDNVIKLADAKKAREEQVQDVAPLEACPPQAIKFDGEDAWHITGCDGEQVYMWIAYRKRKSSKRYTIAEVFPGMLKPDTALRDAESAEDLVLEPEGKFKGTEQIGDVLEDLEALLYEGVEEFDEAEAEE
jgi:hypothetical protein